MTSDNAEDRRRKTQSQPRREPRSAQPAAEPVNPPLLIDGPEAVRDSHC